MTETKENVQVIFVVEGNNKTKTDELYIKAAIEHFDVFPHSWKISFVHMKGKGNFDDRSVQTKIGKLISAFAYSGGKSLVVYAIDSDDEARCHTLNQRIIGYCKKKGYDLIYFSEDVENVFLDHSVTSGEKGRAALRFYADPSFSEKCLESDGFCYGHRKSNILIVIKQLAKY